MKKKIILPFIITIVCLAIVVFCVDNIKKDVGKIKDILTDTSQVTEQIINPTQNTIDNVSKLSASQYNGTPFIAINENEPYFTDEEKTSTQVFEIYSDLDDLGRCGVAYANICKELMPTENRESLSSVTPSGWKNKKYDFIDGGWVYNRAHIIGFQLAGEQANEKNLITGTRYFNVQGMLVFENMIADYVKETDNHVLYRVTPIYNGDNLVAEGVLMEAWSVEDNGDGICFNVFCYNVQPNITIDYATGENWLSNPNTENTNNNSTQENNVYILNTNTKKFHKSTCPNSKDISKINKKEFSGNRDDLIKDNYKPCGYCKP